MKTKPHIAAIALIGSTILISACSKALPVLTVDGVSYTNPMVVSIVTNMMTISHESGTADIPLKSIDWVDFDGVLLNGINKELKREPPLNHSVIITDDDDFVWGCHSADIFLSNTASLSLWSHALREPHRLSGDDYSTSLCIVSFGTQWKYLNEMFLTIEISKLKYRLHIDRYLASVTDGDIIEFVWCTPRVPLNKKIISAGDIKFELGDDIFAIPEKEFVKLVEFNKVVMELDKPRQQKEYVK